MNVPRDKRTVAARTRCASTPEGATSVRPSDVQRDSSNLHPREDPDQSEAHSFLFKKKRLIYRYVCGFFLVFFYIYILFYIFTFSIFTMFFKICFVTAPLNRVTRSHGAIEMLLLLLLLLFSFVCEYLKPDNYDLR